MLILRPGAFLSGVDKREMAVEEDIGRETCETGDHFVVIYGVGWKPSRVFICNQPRFGRSRQELLWADFRATWAPRSHGLICWGEPMPSPSGKHSPRLA